MTDAANILDATSRQTLEQQLSDFEKQTSIEIAVATVPSLEGETIEDYAVALFKQWGVGKRGKDNGVLLLVARNDHKARIEVGYGLESVLNDGLCGQIIRQDLIPAFRENRFGDGIVAGIQSIEKAVQGQYTSTEPAEASRADPMVNAFVLFVLIVLFVVNPGDFQNVWALWGARAKFWRRLRWRRL